MFLRRLVSGFRRGLAAAIVVVAGSIVILLVTTGVEHRTSTTLPKPTGPFAVGRTTFDWVDASAADELAPAVGVKRELAVWVWYPAESASTAAASEYLPPAWQAAYVRSSGVLMSRFLTRDLSQVHTHSISDAALSPTDRAYPVVILRPGGTALTTSFTSLAEDLASHGYIVVGFDAPYMSTFVVLSGGRIVTRLPAYNPEEVPAPQAAQLVDRLLPIWCRDIGFVLNQMQILNGDPSGRFAGRLDLQHIGVVGHSFGGATAAEFCRQDTRCKAGIDLDGMLFGPVVHSGLHQPFMFVLSDQDSSDPENRRVLTDIQSVYDRLPPESRLKLEIRGANHLSFSDQMLIKSQALLGLARALGAVRLDGRRGLAITADYVHSFFDVYLKGQSRTALDASRYPEVKVE